MSSLRRQILNECDQKSLPIILCHSDNCLALQPLRNISGLQQALRTQSKVKSEKSPEQRSMFDVFFVLFVLSIFASNDVHDTINVYYSMSEMVFIMALTLSCNYTK